MSQLIKNIIFDFGDIFINLDKTATPKAMEIFGFTEVDTDLQQLMDKYETGKIDTSSFLENLNLKFPKANTRKLENAWNAIILDFPEERLEFIEALAQEKHYRLFLLSNTNALHIEQVIKNMTLPRYERFQSCFEKFYLSHEIHQRKPDTSIYKWVLDENGLKAEETLFIDDTFVNTKAAEELGIHTWNLQVGKEDIVNLKSRL